MVDLIAARGPWVVGEEGWVRIASGSSNSNLKLLCWKLKHGRINSWSRRFHQLPLSASCQVPDLDGSVLLLLLSSFLFLFLFLVVKNYIFSWQPFPPVKFLRESVQEKKKRRREKERGGSPDLMVRNVSKARGRHGSASFSKEWAATCAKKGRRVCDGEGSQSHPSAL